MSRRRKEELLNKPYWNLIHQQDLRRIRRHINVVFQDQVKDFEIESRILTKNGEVINSHQRLRLIHAQKGTPSELRILCRDVTKRATSQQERLDEKSASFSESVIYARLMYTIPLNISEHVEDWLWLPSCL